tara:strand:- start:1293 stop:2420 length:1128 start_codon:yes stop_codon:yes gene_type:complete
VKVLVVFTYGYSLKTWFESGTIERELSIYRELHKKFQHKFIFVTYGDESDENYIQNDAGLEVVPIYKFINHSEYKLINIIKSIAFPFLQISQFKDIDLIKQNQLLGSWVSVLFSKLLKKPLFTRTGYDMYKFSIEDKKNVIIKYLYLFLTNFTLRFSNLYSVSNNADFDYSKKKYSSSKKIILSPNWVLPNKSMEFDSRFSNRILCVGRLVNQKNFSYIIKEFKDSHFEIDIIGEGEEYESLKHLSSNLNVKVNFLKNVKNDLLLRKMSEYKYFISSSLFEGHPKTVIEAMSSGCIVFLSNIQNHSELITNGKDGFIFNLEKNNLKKIFQLNVSKSNDLEKVSLNAINKSISKFGLEKICHEENENYNRLQKTNL